MSTLTSNQSSAYNRMPKAVLSDKVSVGGKTRTVKTYVPLHQSRTIRGHQTFNTTSFKSVPANLFNGSGQRFVGQIQMGSIGLIKSATLRITMNISGAVGDTLTFADAPHFIDRLEVKSQNGSKHLTTLHDDVLWYNLNLVDGDRSFELMKKAGMSQGFAKWGGTGISANGTTGDFTFHIPILGSIFGHSPVYFGNASGDMNIELFSASSKPYIVTAGNAVVTCQGIDLIVESEALSIEDQLFHKNHHDGAICSTRFLEPVENHFYSQSLTAGQEVKVDMDAVTGDVSHLLVAVQATGQSNQTPAGAFTSVSLNNCKVDILNSTGKSLYGEGQPVPIDIFNSEVFPSHFATTFLTFNNWLTIPFAQDLKNAYHGVKDGCLRFDQNRKYVSLTLPNTWTTGTYDVKIYAFVYRKLSSSQGRFVSSDDLD